MTTIDRGAIVARARSFKDVPYQHQGRTRNGLDCLGLCWVTYSKFVKFEEADFPEGSFDYFHNYARDPDPKRMGEGFQRFFYEVPQDQALPGDMIWLKILGAPKHMGIVTAGEPLRMIHAYGQLGRHSRNRMVGRVVEHDLDPKWERRVHRILRLKGL